LFWLAEHFSGKSKAEYYFALFDESFAVGSTGNDGGLAFELFGHLSFSVVAELPAR
jgi:hypothetical protein